MSSVLDVCRFLGIDAEKCKGINRFVKVVDFAKCIDCETCLYVCEFLYGRSNVKLVKTVIGVEKPVSCFHCDPAPCMDVCKRKAIVRRRDGAIHIVPEKCNNCLDCYYACPFKAIRLGRRVPTKCDLCEDLVKKGLEPACIAMCPTKAIKLVKLSQ